MRKNRFIWVIIAALCLSMVALVGCGSSEDTEETADSPYPMIVEDNEYFTFELVGSDDLWEEYTYKITNKTEQDIIFDCEKTIINSETTVDAFIYADIAKGTSTKDSFYLGEEELSDYGEDEELTMTVQYEIYNSDYSTITSGSFDFVVPR